MHTFLYETFIQKEIINLSIKAKVSRLDFAGRVCGDTISSVPFNTLYIFTNILKNQHELI